jgi:hypothetical protein
MALPRIQHLAESKYKDDKFNLMCSVIVIVDSIAVVFTYVLANMAVTRTHIHTT